MPRTVTVILVDETGALLGARPPVEVGAPWWQEVAEFAGTWQVLRLLHSDQPAPPGGHVTYLAETGEAPRGLRPVAVDLAPHAKRAPYAEPGGPAASIAWAVGVLRERGIAARAHQQRTWNLSAIWRMDGPPGEPVAWLKQVPAFFAHEPTALRLVDEVAPGLVPPLLAAGPLGRMLLGHVPGADRHGAGTEVCERIAAAFHPVQAHFAGHLDRLAGIPDGRLDAARLAAVSRPWYDRVAGLRGLIDDLPRRLAEVVACGLPDTLVHGDLHPGNVRTDDSGRLTILDWGDGVVGHPALDILRLTGDLDDPGAVLTRWAYRWQQAVPGSDPLRAARLLRPVAALRAAATYTAFLEPSNQLNGPTTPGTSRPASRRPSPHRSRP